MAAVTLNSDLWASFGKHGAAPRPPVLSWEWLVEETAFVFGGAEDVAEPGRLCFGKQDLNRGSVSAPVSPCESKAVLTRPHDST